MAPGYVANPSSAKWLETPGYVVAAAYVWVPLGNAQRYQAVPFAQRISGSADDSKIWVDDYVSVQARTQFTTGNPGPLADVLGGDQGQPGSLGVGKDLTFKFRTSAKTDRVTAMVHPDKTPDNYVTVLVDLESKGSFELVRFDIGDDEERKTVQTVGPAGSVKVQ